MATQMDIFHAQGNEVDRIKEKLMGMLDIKDCHTATEAIWLGRDVQLQLVATTVNARFVPKGVAKINRYGEILDLNEHP